MSSYAELVVDRSINDAWKTFRSRLADVLVSDLSAPIRFRPLGSTRSVMVTSTGEGKALAVVARVGTSGRAHVRELGFAYDARRWTVEVDPRHVDRVAFLVSTVLHEVLGVIHPSLLDAEPHGLGLWDDLADETPAPIEVPALAYPDDVEGLRTLIDLTLTQAMGHAPSKDDDGDIPIHTEAGGRVYVSVRDDWGVEVWSVLATKVSHAKARRAIVRLTREYQFHRFQIWGDALIASVTVAARPFVPALLDSAIGGTLYLSETQSDGLSRALRRPRKHRSKEPRPAATASQDALFPDEWFLGDDESSRHRDRGDQA
jgi:hypothetical protein